MRFVRPIVKPLVAIAVLVALAFLTRIASPALLRACDLNSPASINTPSNVSTVSEIVHALVAEGLVILAGLLGGVALHRRGMAKIDEHKGIADGLGRIVKDLEERLAAMRQGPARERHHTIDLQDELLRVAAGISGGDRDVLVDALATVERALKVQHEIARDRATQNARHDDLTAVLSQTRTTVHEHVYGQAPEPIDETPQVVADAVVAVHAEGKGSGDLLDPPPQRRSTDNPSTPTAPPSESL